MRSADSHGKREQIMQAAERLFASRRFHEVTLDEVAKAAGVGKGTIYLHFADKDDLFLQAATAGFAPLCAIVEQGCPAGVPFRQGLLDLCRQIEAFFNRRHRLLRMMQIEEGRAHCRHGTMRNRWESHRRQLVTALGRVLGVGVGEGAIRPDVPPEALAAFLLGSLRTRAREIDAAEAVSIEAVVSLFLDGAAPRPEDGPSGAHGRGNAC